MAFLPLRIYPLLLVPTLLLWAMPGMLSAADTAREDLLVRQEEISAELRQAMAELVTWSQQQGLPELAERAGKWMPDPDPLLIRIPKLPRQMEPASLPEGTSPGQRQWSEKFWAAREQAARQYFTLAQEAVETREYGLARLFVLEATRQTPDDENLRKLLGFQAFRDQWLTPWEVNQIGTRGMVWDEQFGWLPAGDVEKYRAGMRRIPTLRYGARFVRGGWVSADREAELRSDIDHGWQVETEHYRVTTNQSLEAGVKLAARLEELHWVWTHLFFTYWASPIQQQQVLEAPRRRSTRRPFLHEVVYFRDRQEYLNKVQPGTQADASISTGVYFSDEERAYFFAGSEFSEITLLHEATHQLFSEANPRARAVGRRPRFWENKRANFWVVEGIACYMETLREQDGYYVVGGLDNDRCKSAAYRLLEQQWYKPLGELTNYGMVSLLRDQEISGIYSQGAALTTFLMHAEDGQYRQPFMDYLEAVYTGKDRPDSLEALIGVNEATLDQQYQGFIRKRFQLSE